MHYCCRAIGAGRRAFLWNSPTRPTTVSGTLKIQGVVADMSVPMQQESQPFVSVILPAYNEGAVLEENVGTIMDYLRTLESAYRFEVLLVNDGSKDDTGTVADRLTSKYSNLRVLHHPINFGLGQAFRTGFAQSRGDYVITMDVDLSYAPEHIGTLLQTIRTTRAKLVLV